MDDKPKLGANRGNAGKGRPKGSPNKATALLKDTILAAGEAAHPEGLLGYLTAQASANPVAYLTLLGKVLPMTVAGDQTSPLAIRVVIGGD